MNMTISFAFLMQRSQKWYLVPEVNDSQAPVLLQVYGNENHVEREDVNVLVPPLDRALVPGGHEVTNVYHKDQ